MRLVSLSARSVAVFAALALLSAPVLAQGTAEQRAACTDDALRFCGPEIPNVARIQACLIHYMSQLSQRCQAQFHRPHELKDLSKAGRFR